MVDPSGDSELFEHEIGVDEDIIEMSLSGYCADLVILSQVQATGLVWDLY